MNVPQLPFKRMPEELALRAIGAGFVMQLETPVFEAKKNKRNKNRQVIKWID